ncbi:MAG: FIST C-terminal domain-containing protein [Myxococcales bacterium]|nr:FIST C-terminal domain-containing protein [Myxococcales bacterium]
MTLFSSAVSCAPILVDALDEAMARARADLGDHTPSLAIVFASDGYASLEAVAGRVAEHLPGVPFVGGTSGGCVFDTTRFGYMGVCVALLAGGDLRVETRAVPIVSGELLEVATAAEELRLLADAHAEEGRGELTCLAFAPSRGIVGDALVAALKKGATARAQLVGGLLAQEGSMSGGRVWSSGGVSEAHVVLAGLYTERPLGVAVRHGWTPIGDTHRVTRADGARLHELDGRPALDVWLEEATRHGGEPLPCEAGSLALHLAARYELAILGTEAHLDGEPIVRGSRVIHDDRTVELFGSVPEGAQVRFVTATEGSLFAAAKYAAEHALGKVARASGALALTCAGRAFVLGDRYRLEPELLAATLGVPVGGTTVTGEIALARRAADGFYNSTAVLLVFPR